jgi:excisionase family DNA binding protein
MTHRGRGLGGGRREAPVSTKITSLEHHPENYVTVGQLAEYWQVSRKQIYKHIDAGTLEAIRFGPRLYRIQTKTALDFEQRAQMRPHSNHTSKNQHRHR